MLTNKGKYGLKAMVHLARLREDEIAQVAQIAKANNIPKKFLDQILADLRRVGLVHSKKGKAGGYALSKPANEIRVGRALLTVLSLPSYARARTFTALARTATSKSAPCVGS